MSSLSGMESFTPDLCFTAFKNGAPQASGVQLWRHVTNTSQDSSRDGNGDGKAEDEI